MAPHKVRSRQKCRKMWTRDVGYRYRNDQACPGACSGGSWALGSAPPRTSMPSWDSPSPHPGIISGKFQLKTVRIKGGTSPEPKHVSAHKIDVLKSFPARGAMVPLARIRRCRTRLISTVSDGITSRRLGRGIAVPPAGYSRGSPIIPLVFRKAFGLRPSMRVNARVNALVSE